MARPCYAGETRPIEIKQNAWEESGAHPKHIRAERGTGGATEKRVDDHSSHGDASYVDGGVPVAVVDKRINQPGTKHHGNMGKLELCRAREKTHRRVLATVTRTRRRCCRPQGRKATLSISR